MNFEKAIKLLKEGKKIKRSVWNLHWEVESYQTLIEKRSSVMIVAHLENGGISPVQITQQDVFAEDWEVVD